MESQWRVYVGAEVPRPASHSSSTATPADLLDSAFARRAAYTLQRTSAELRRHPSAAPSPILRWLLQTESNATVPSPAKPAAATASPTPSKPSTGIIEGHETAKSNAEEAIKPSTFSTTPAAAVSALARRGVGPKDPLLQRLLKKKQQQEQQQQQQGSVAASANSHDATSIASKEIVPVSHWTRHPFSAMSATSWRVFRQQLGITVELVAPALTASASAVATVKPPLQTAATPTTNVSASATLKMPAAESLAAIRCWEEAQLPLSLGRCVAQTYALPTAVQAQCVPLALLPTPSLPSPTHTVGSSTTHPIATATSLGMDVLAVAETGSGKTAAYLIPLLYHVLCRAPKLLGHPDRISLGPLSLVIVPTRELAEQVTGSLWQLCGQQQQQQTSSSPTASSSNIHNSSGGVRQSDIAAWEAEERSSALPLSAAEERNRLTEFRVVKVVGGENREAQYHALANGAHCVVGTVGQLQMLLEDRLLSLGNTQFVVMDEADRMIDEQQAARLVAVLERCPTPRQTLLFTATLSAACAGVAKRYLARAGYYLVRTPYRCASIRQSFELVSSAAADVAAEAAIQPPPPRQQHKVDAGSAESGNHNKDASGKTPSPQQQQKQRRLSSLVHPQKFARLVAWLVYGSGPIIVFANEKATCDALFDELRAEAEHLDAQQEYFTIADLIGPPPEGLVFREGNEKVPPTAAVSSRTPSLLNLTSVAVVHSELSQSERRNLVTQFQRRQRQVLITTDLLARGLDVAGVTLVVNYDVPWSATSPSDALTLYIHRIGRTGRAGSTGVTVTFITLPAAMVQRAEEVVKEERDAGKGHQKQQKGSTDPKASADMDSFARDRARGKGVDDDDDDPMRAMEELFDGDTHNVWAAGVSAMTEGGSGRKRRRGDFDNEDGSEEEDKEALGNDEDDEGGAHNANNSRTAAGRPGEKKGGLFASDVAVLRPLWLFLTECAEGEGCKDGAAALQRGAYAKISVPPALACIMAQLSATSQYGRITL